MLIKKRGGDHGLLHWHRYEPSLLRTEDITRQTCLFKGGLKMNILQCWAVRTVLRSYPAEKLTHAEHAALAQHIANCPKCARES